MTGGMKDSEQRREGALEQIEMRSTVNTGRMT